VPDQYRARGDDHLVDRRWRDVKLARGLILGWGLGRRCAHPAFSVAARNPVTSAPRHHPVFATCLRGVLMMMVAATLLSSCGRTAGIVTAESGRGFDKVTISLLAEGKPDPIDTAVTGYLFKPKGSGPFPAVILMHGCDGLEWERPQQASWRLLQVYAEQYGAHGYVALILDSFARRGITNICGNGLAVAPQRRAWDAYSAASYLASLGYVDRRRLVLEGDSHGGWATLVALQQRQWHAPVRFAAGIAWYPYCPAGVTFTAPILILIGESDDWTPADRCKSLVERLHNQPDQPDIEIRTFPGATHAYDFPYPPRINAQGHRMAYDETATEQSWQAISVFLGEHIGPWPAR
jgi:dienelactone hydrolase